MPKPPYDISPQIGYGPIKFGMSPDEVAEHLGKPVKSEPMLSKSETDEDDIKFYGNQAVAWYGDKYPQAIDAQLTYEDEKVVVITLFKREDALIYKDMDLHSFKNRQDVLEALAQEESEYYRHRERYFFPKSGLIVPIPKYMKRLFYIHLALTTYMLPRLKFERYKPSKELE